TRHGERGLATAVVRGIEESSGQYIVVMDADLSHPPSAIPSMLELLIDDQSDFVVGSRYVDGGSIHGNWTTWRRLNSRLPTWLVKPLTPIRDPMSGFFALRRCQVPDSKRFNAIGYKIGLEIYVKGEFTNPVEVPIHFAERQNGVSKLGLLEQLSFLRHLRRLYQYRFPRFSELLQFAGIGATGFVVDLSVYLSLQLVFSMDHRVARAISFFVAASWNWGGNRIVTFPHRPKTPKLKQWPIFLATSAIGFVVNWGSYVLLTTYVPFFDRHKIVALLIGVLLGMGVNFLGAHKIAFRRAQ
ncbi:MAG: GtrA family protein, partial [Gammaproteobacteria bacterium]|nr:GtrA family protein [Gammaproteobacteria bacterium]